MRLAVLANPDSWYVRDLERAAAGFAGGCRIEMISFADLRSRLGGASIEVHSGEFDLARHSDAVLVRTMPPGSLEQVVFRMDALGQLHAAGKLVVNSPRAIEAAVDKYLASARLQAAGLATPRTCVCQTADDAMAAFEELGGDVVVKPIFGSEGRGIARVSDEPVALRVFKTLAGLNAVLYVQEFIEHEGRDLRLLVVGRKVLGMARINRLDWRTNVSRGATTEPLEVTPELGDTALAAAEAVGAAIAGVDLLPGRDGRLYAIEVNAVPGWKALARTLRVDVARLVLEYLREKLGKEG